jgi:hypothetical protein
MDVDDFTRLQPQNHPIANNGVVPDELILELDPPILANVALEGRAIPAQLPPCLGGELYEAETRHTLPNEEARLLRLGGELPQDPCDPLE